MDLGVAVIVPVYNRADLIIETIETILRQDYADFRLYLVDDGSTDGTAAILEEYAAAHPRVSAIRQPNLGQAAAINHGIRRSTEPLIALCDADDLWHPRRLEQSVRALQAAPDAGFACTDFCRGQDPSQPWVSAWAHFGYQPETTGAFDRLLKENFVHRSSATFRRDHVTRAGLFSEEIAGVCGSDDWDMWLKLSRVGPATCVHEVLVWVRQWPGQDSSTVRAVESQVRLWRHWNREVRQQRERRQITAKKLATTLLGLAWAYRRNRRFRAAAAAYVEALLCGNHTRSALVGLAKLFVATSMDFTDRQRRTVTSRLGFYQ